MQDRAATNKSDAGNDLCGDAGMVPTELAGEFRG